MKRKVSIIFLDLDGTLLTSEKTISDDTVATLQRCHAKGIKVCLASGRMTDRITAYENRLGFDFYIMSYNGARCVAPRAEGRRMLFDNPLSTESTNKIMDYCLEHRLCQQVYYDEKLFVVKTPEHQKHIDVYIKSTGSVYHYVDSLDQFRDKPVTKMLVVDTPERRNELFDSLQDVFEPGVSLLKSNPELLEFLQPGTDKGMALPRMCEALGIPVEESLAFGDGDNDVGLLRSAGYGIAMANACAAARGVADKVSEHNNNEDAIAKEIELIVEGL